MTWVAMIILNKDTCREQNDNARQDQLDQEDDIKGFAFFERIIQTAGNAKKFGKRIGRGKGDNDQSHKTGVQDPDTEQLPARFPAKGWMAWAACSPETRAIPWT